MVSEQISVNFFVSLSRVCFHIFNGVGPDPYANPIQSIPVLEPIKKHLMLKQFSLELHTKTNITGTGTVSKPLSPSLIVFRSFALKTPMCSWTPRAGLPDIRILQPTKNAEALQRWILRYRTKQIPNIVFPELFLASFHRPPSRWWRGPPWAAWPPPWGSWRTFQTGAFSPLLSRGGPSGP